MPLSSLGPFTLSRPLGGPLLGNYFQRPSFSSRRAGDGRKDHVEERRRACEPSGVYVPTQQEALSQSVDALKAALAEGFDAHSADDRIGTVWHHAVFSPSRTSDKKVQARCAEVVDYLLSREDLTVPGPAEQGATPLGLAILTGRLGLVQRLVARGARLGPSERPLIEMISNGYAHDSPERVLSGRVGTTQVELI
jgi:hypothetical protein